jgi:predicted Fe-Mo cluster-binding NifX family protein
MGRAMAQSIAIPVFGEEIAPRFCFAANLMFVDVEEGAVVRRERLDVRDLGWGERLELIAARGAKILVCGGFNRRYLPLATALGISVRWGHCGVVEAVIAELLEGDVSSAGSPNVSLQGCRRQRRGNAKRQRGPRWKDRS